MNLTKSDCFNKMLSFIGYTIAISTLILAKIIMSRRTRPSPAAAGKAQNPTPSTPLTNNRHLLHALVLHTRVQNLIPSVSLAKALMTLLYKEDESLESLCKLPKTSSAPNPLIDTTTALLQILMSQTVKEPTAFCCDKHKKYFTSLLNGAKIYVRHRDGVSVDQRDLDSEDLKNFQEIMSLFLASVDSTDNNLNVLFSTRETFKTILLEQRTYDLRINDIIANIIKLEKKIANKLKEAHKIPDELTFNLAELLNEEYKELEKEFCLINYLNNDEFAEFWGECSSISQEWSADKTAVNLLFNPNTPLKCKEKFHIDGQKILFSVLLKGKLTIPEIFEYRVLSFDNLITLSCLIRSYISSSFSNSLEECLLISKNDITIIITSLTIYGITLKIAESNLKPDEIQVIYNEIDEMKSKISSIYRKWNSVSTGNSISSEISKVKRRIYKELRTSLINETKDFFCKLKKTEKEVYTLYAKKNQLIMPTLDKPQTHQESKEDTPVKTKPEVPPTQYSPPKKRKKNKKAEPKTDSENTKHRPIDIIDQNIEQPYRQIFEESNSSLKKIEKLLKKMKCNINHLKIGEKIKKLNSHKQKIKSWKILLKEKPEKSIYENKLRKEIENLNKTIKTLEDALEKEKPAFINTNSAAATKPTTGTHVKPKKQSATPDKPSRLSPTLFFQTGSEHEYKKTTNPHFSAGRNLSDTTPSENPRSTGSAPETAIKHTLSLFAYNIGESVALVSTTRDQASTKDPTCQASYNLFQTENCLP